MRRHMLRMNQQTLGLRIGVAFQQVQKYEKEPIGSGPRASSKSWTYWRRHRLGSSRVSQGHRNGRGSADTGAAERVAFMSDQYAVLLIRSFVKLRPELRHPQQHGLPPVDAVCTESSSAGDPPCRSRVQGTARLRHLDDRSDAALAHRRFPLQVSGRNAVRHLRLKASEIRSNSSFLHSSRKSWRSRCARSLP